MRLPVAQSPAFSSLNEWHHWVFVWDNSTGASIYLDGQHVSGPSGTWVAEDQVGEFYIGQLEGASDRFKGDMDQFQIYNRSLTPEQILLLYQNRTDMISFNETSIGDVWEACVTPNDGTEDGVENCSNTLTVLDAANVVPIAFNDSTN